MYQSIYNLIFSSKRKVSFSIHHCTGANMNTGFVLVKIHYNPRYCSLDIFEINFHCIYTSR